MTRILLACVAVLALAGGAAADPWTNESGQGRGGGERGVGVFIPLPGVPGRPPPVRAEPRIPPGHMPPPGECRTWIPGVPAGQQPPPYPCR